MNLADVPPGRVILLNGATSSGKSSIATQLLGQLDRPYFHMPVDGINAMRADGWAARLGAEGVAQTRRRRGHENGSRRSGVLEPNRRVHRRFGGSPAV